MGMDRIDIRDLALMLGPGKHDIKDRTLIISDGAGREIEVLLDEGSIEVKDNGYVIE